MGKIKVLIKRPDEEVGHITYISNTLENLQRTVGGYIQVVPLITEDAVIICNEEGKLLGLEPNFTYQRDMIVGTVILAGVDGDEFADIPAYLTRTTWERFLLNEKLKA